LAAPLSATPLRSGGRRSATARTVARSKRRFRAKTKNQEHFGTHRADARALPPFATLRFSPCPPVTVFVSLPLK